MQSSSRADENVYCVPISASPGSQSDLQLKTKI